jgi:phosphoribosylamine--glycine ligase
MNVLLIGSGGREHAMACALAASPRLDRLYCAPGNAGIAQEAEIVGLDVADADAVIGFARKRAINLVIIGPEAPLAAGLVDALEAADIRAFGPSRAAAALESSKAFTKALCREAGIPTAGFAVFEDAEAAKDHVRNLGAPIVVKADGLAAGKGVVVAQSVAEAEAAIDEMMEGAFGAAGHRLVIEEALTGEEASLFALCDGNTALLFGTAEDHKRAYDGDQGPNTGGMGAISPSPLLDAETCTRVMDEIVRPTLQAMRARGTPFRGFLYAGLMLTEQGPKLIEFNVRFGDPEAQVVLIRVKDDFLSLLEAAAKGALSGMQVRLGEDHAVTVVMAAQGYPGPYETGSEIRGLDAAAALPGVTLFHAGTKREGQRFLSNGGRVLNVTAVGPTLAEARARAYAAVERIDWPQGRCRSDIGQKAMTREKSR